MKTPPLSRRAAMVVGEHDECVGSAQFEHGLLQIAAGSRRDRNAGGLAAGECHRRNAPVVDQMLDFFAGDDQGRERSVWKTGVAKDLLDVQRAARNVGRMLEHADVPGHQRGRGEPKHLPKWKVPRHDGEHGAERPIPNEAFGRI